VNELAIEQMKEYAEKMGKYRKYLIKHMDDCLLHKLVEVNYKVRSPIINLSHFLKQTLDDVTVQKHGNHLAQLVNFRAVEIDAEICALLDDRSFWRCCIGPLRPWWGACCR
jgi:hypothetical protein